MFKKIITRGFTLIVFVIFSHPLFADLIVLKSGGIRQGEILSETSAGVKLKDKSGAVKEVKRSLIASIVKDKKLSLNSEELYEQKSKSIPAGDAKTHYELGLFCMKNNMLDYAFKEFNLAKEIDPKYEKLIAKEVDYIETVRKKAEEIKGRAGRFKEERLPLSPNEITDELKKNGVAIPLSRKDVGTIVGVINNLSGDAEKQKYARRYLELGGDYEKKIKAGDSHDAFSYDTLNVALFCYEIANNCAVDPQTSSLAQQKIRDINDKLEKIQEAELIIPYSVLDKDAIILFIRRIKGPADKNSYYARYYYKGAEFETRAKNYGVSAGKDGRKNLEIALYCYEIAKSAYVRDLLVSGLIEAKIKECRELLEEMGK